MLHLYWGSIRTGRGPLFIEDTRLRYRKLIKILLLFAVLLLMAGIVYLALRNLMPGVVELLRSGRTEDIQAYLRSEGPKRSIACVALLQVLQIWSVFISGIPLQMAAGVVLGTLVGFVVCHVMSVFALTTLMVAWRKIGGRLEKWLALSDSNLRVMDKLRNLNSPPRYIIVLSCLIPVLPKGLVPVMAAKMDITTRQFAFATWVGSIPNIFLCCVIGSSLINGHWAVTVAAMLGMFLLVAALWIFMKPVLRVLRRIRAFRVDNMEALRGRFVVKD